MVRRRRSKNTGIRGLFYTYSIFMFGIRFGGGVRSLGFWLHFEASPVSRTHLICRWHFLRPLAARSSASRQKLGMDALVTVCSWNTNGILVLAWMLWSPCALGTRTQLWFWHVAKPKREHSTPETDPTIKMAYV